MLDEHVDPHSGERGSGERGLSERALSERALSESGLGESGDAFACKHSFWAACQAGPQALPSRVRLPLQTTFVA